MKEVIIDVDGHPVKLPSFYDNGYPTRVPPFYAHVFGVVGTALILIAMVVAYFWGIGYFFDMADTADWAGLETLYLITWIVLGIPALMFAVVASFMALAIGIMASMFALILGILLSPLIAVIYFCFFA